MTRLVHHPAEPIFLCLLFLELSNLRFRTEILQKWNRHNHKRGRYLLFLKTFSVTTSSLLSPLTFHLVAFDVSSYFERALAFSLCTRLNVICFSFLALRLSWHEVRVFTLEHLDFSRLVSVEVSGEH